MPSFIRPIAVSVRSVAIAALLGSTILADAPHRGAGAVHRDPDPGGRLGHRNQGRER